MNETEKTEAIRSIQRIQAGTASEEDFQALERTTGNPDIWILFEALELEGFRPEKILNLLVWQQPILIQ
ncbi:MAG TPA: hypothetical protein VG347_14090 [Verrucomicrobiae bacterium]|nr:hypothetical protein [Verrucomicrobiae bacterium]